MTQEHYVKSESDARTQCRDVTLIIADIEIADKEKTHSANTENDRDEITQVKLFADDEGCKDQNVDRGRVLEKYSVGGGRVLGGPHEEKQKRGIDARRHQAERVYPQSIAPRDDQDRNSGQQ